MVDHVKARIEYGKASPEARRAMYGLAEYLDQSGLERPLLNLIDLRASQINGWNRLSIAFRTVPGTYQPARSQKLKQRA
jgi:hypothetical protein